MGKTMKAVAVEEEKPSEPFTAVLLYMEKLGCIGSVERWKDIRELRNAADRHALGIALQLLRCQQEQAPGSDWREAPTGELIEHILARYHQRHREQLPELIRLATEDGSMFPNSNTPARFSPMRVNSPASAATTAGDCS